MRLKDKEMKDITLTDDITTDEITLDDVIKILEIKNRLLVLSIS
jgi:hypothetical protein